MFGNIKAQGLVMAEKVMIELVEMASSGSHEILRSASFEAVDKKIELIDVCIGNSEITAAFSAEELEAMFEPMNHVEFQIEIVDEYVKLARDAISTSVMLVMKFSSIPDHWLYHQFDFSFKMGSADNKSFIFSFTIDIKSKFCDKSMSLSDFRLIFFLPMTHLCHLKQLLLSFLQNHLLPNHSYVIEEIDATMEYS